MLGQRKLAGFLEDLAKAAHQELEVPLHLGGVERQNRRQDHRVGPVRGNAGTTSIEAHARRAPMLAVGRRGEITAIGSVAGNGRFVYILVVHPQSASQLSDANDIVTRLMSKPCSRPGGGGRLRSHAMRPTA